MKTSSLPFSVTWLLCLSIVFFGCSGGAPSVDVGDGSVGNLVWGVYHYGFGVKDVDKALAYADKAVELHGDEARSMQASLSDFPATDPPEETYKYAALNDVGASVLAKAELLMRRGDRAGAEEAFSMVVQEFGYAQVQDLGEWEDYATSVARDERGFIRIADVAKQRLADIKAGKD